MLCIPIVGPTLDLALEQILEAQACADILELRTDLFTFSELELLRSCLKLPYIVKGPTHGLSPTFVDGEGGEILSYHNFSHTPENLEEILQEMQKTPATYYKIATMAHSTLDSLRMLALMKAHPNLIGVCMGKKGEITRILGPVFGCPITYASLNPDWQSAPGQLTARELCETYRFRTLNSSTALYGLIGDPVDFSISHQSHNALLGRLGHNAVYVKMEIKKEELPEFFRLAKLLGFRGLSVTMPHKEQLLPFLNEYNPLEAINTVHFYEGQVLGYNTDGKGALDALEERGFVQGKSLVILGAGGAAKAIAYEAKKRGTSVSILNRTEARALQLAKELEVKGGPLSLLQEMQADIVINATPVGMPIDPAWLRGTELAMEIKTVPKETTFLKEAQKRGCACVFGYEMFINQAVGQFVIWGLGGSVAEIKKEIALPDIESRRGFD